MRHLLKECEFTKKYSLTFKRPAKILKIILKCLRLYVFVLLCKHSTRRDMQITTETRRKQKTNSSKTNTAT